MKLSHISEMYVYNNSNESQVASSVSRSVKGFCSILQFCKDFSIFSYCFIEF